jgi:adenylate cyclase
MAHCVLGYAQLSTGQPQKAIASLERAVELDPSLAVAHGWLGDALCWAGRADEAIASVEKAMRMSPHDPLTFGFLHIMGIAHACTRRYEEAIGWLERSLQLVPSWPPTLLWATSTYAHLGRLDEARAALERLVRVWPGYSLSRAREIARGYDPVSLEAVVDGLRKAGLPE